MIMFAVACLVVQIDTVQESKQSKPASAEFIAVTDGRNPEGATTLLIDARTVKQNCGTCHSPTPDSKALVCPRGHGALAITDYMRSTAGQHAEVRFHPYVTASLSLAPTPADRLGLTLKPVGDGLRTHLKLASDAGLLVEDITKDSVLADADVKKFDVVVAVDNVPVKEPQKAADLLLTRAKDDREFALSLVREGTPRVAKLRLAPALRGRLLDSVKSEESRFRVGVSLAGVDETLRQHLKIPTGEGAVVTSVETGSAAADANIKQHDILLRWNNESIAGPEGLLSVIQKNGGATAKVVLFREGKKTLANVTPKPLSAPAEVFQIQGDLINRINVQPTDGAQTLLGSLYIANANVHLEAEGSIEKEVAAALTQVKSLESALGRLQATIAAKKQSEKAGTKKK